MSTIVDKIDRQRKRFDKINASGDLPLILIDDDLCQDFQENINVKKKLGQGVQGTAYLVDVPGMGESQFVLKELISPVKDQIVPIRGDNVTYEDLAKFVKRKYFIPEKVIYSINNVKDPKDGVMITQVGKDRFTQLVLPEKLVDCITDKKLYHPIAGTSTRVPPNSWICDDYEPLSDFYFGQLCSSLYTSGQSINFLPLFGYARCPPKKEITVSPQTVERELRKIINFVSRIVEEKVLEDYSYDDEEKRLARQRVREMKSVLSNLGSLSTKEKLEYINEFASFFTSITGDQLNINNELSIASGLKSNNEIYSYLLMQKIDTTLRQTTPSMFIQKEGEKYIFNKKNIHSLLFQILHSLALMQEKFGLIHGDLHDDNIFIEFVKEDTIFNDKHVADADYFHYKVGDIDFYLPATSFIVKIGDFGLTKQITQGRIVMDNWANREASALEGDVNGFFTNWFSTSYDILFSVHTILRKFKLNRFIDPTFRSLIKKVFSVKNESVDESINTLQYKFVRTTGRPTNRMVVEKDNDGVTPRNVLTSDEIFGVYTQKPSNGKIITFGTI